MSMGIPSAKFAGGGDFHRAGIASRKAKVAPSIAEQAIFIPKPHKRVEFTLAADPQVMGSGKGGQPLPTLGGAEGGKPAPLPGSGQTGSVALPGSGDAAVTKGGNGQNISQGNLGTNGLTAQFNTAAYSGGSAGGKVEMQILSDPTKQREVIATQEEGRQVNHKEIHFTQQYDSYGRPRIGFSREPYDFAATKFMSITSQVRFESNMAKVHDQYNAYLIDPTKQDPSAKESAPAETPIFGNSSDPTAQQDAAAKQVKLMGQQGASDPSSVKKSAADAFESSKVKVKDIFAKGAASGKGDAEGVGDKEGAKGESGEGNISGGGTVNVKA